MPLGNVFAVMATSALSLAALPAGVFLTLGPFLVSGTGGPLGASEWATLWATLAGAVAVCAFALHMTSFSLIQYTQCPSRSRRYTQAARLAGMATGVALLFLALAAVPFLRALVTDRLPASTPTPVAQAVAVGYFLAWGGAIAASVGASLASICAPP